MTPSAGTAHATPLARIAAMAETEGTNPGAFASITRGQIAPAELTRVATVPKATVTARAQTAEAVNVPASAAAYPEAAMQLPAWPLVCISGSDEAFLIEKLLNTIRERDRMWLVSVWVHQRPCEVNFRSWLALGFSLADSGLVEHPDEVIPIENIGRDFSIGAAGLRGWIMIVKLVVCTLKVDENGCIVDLSIIGLNFHLSGFRHLETLKSFTITGCESLAVEELSKLTSLRHLNLSGCPRILSDFPMDLEIKTVTDLDIDLGEKTPPPQFLAWMTKKRSLPNLEILDFPGTKECNVSIVLNALCCAETSFREQLRGIGFSKSELKEKHLKRIVLELLPRFANLYHLLLGANQIGSFRDIVESIEEGIGTNSPQPLSSIRVLDINYNPLFKIMKNEPKEKKAMLRFLEIFPSIRTLCTLDVDDEIKYALMKNDAGRSHIVEVGSDGNGSSRLPISLSLWPLVLKRASEHWCQGRPDAPATKLFYLTRNCQEPAINASERLPVLPRETDRKRKRLSVRDF